MRKFQIQYGVKKLSVRWVITKKENSDGKKKMKACLVARGFEEKGKYSQIPQLLVTRY